MASLSTCAQQAGLGDELRTRRLGADGRFVGEYVAAPDPAARARRFELWEKFKNSKSPDSTSSSSASATSSSSSVATKGSPIEVVLPDGAVQQGKSSTTTPMDVATAISSRLASEVVVALVQYHDVATMQALRAQCVAADSMEDDEDGDVGEGEAYAEPLLWDLTRPLVGSCKLQLLKFDDPKGREVFFHSAAHVLGAAIEESFGGLLTVGPAVDKGFYYDAFLGSKRLSSEGDLETLTRAAERICQEDRTFERLELSKDEALELFADNPFKVDLIQRKVGPGTVTTAYKCGDFIDLCRGPHLPRTNRIKAFEAVKTSSAYWLGSADHDSLQRVYGIAFPSAKQLRQHKQLIEEASKRDHRKIGKQQELFFFNAVASPGSCFWTAHGTRIFNRLQELLRAEYRVRNFQEVITPNIYAADLFKRSGHYQNYNSDMYGFKVEGQEWFLKPMNCPGHCLLFESRPRSHRELPLRLASFGVLHRNELSGTLAGLTRVRRFQQDDGHIFCGEDQIFSEVTNALEFVFDLYKLFGFEFTLALSTRPKKAMGSQELWTHAEDQLRQALDNTGKPWTLNKGDGAFYGPKIDIRLQDALGRRHQCGTVQLDFQLPLRFGLRYQAADQQAPENTYGQDDQKKQDHAEVPPTTADEYGTPVPLPPGFKRPVIIHRAIFGSLERFSAILAEHFGGKWPFWLSPRQCVVVPVSEDAFGYAAYVRNALHARGFHVEVNLGSGTLNKKVREAQLAQWNYILVVGKEEEESMSVNVRQRGLQKPVGTRDLIEFMDELDQENSPGALGKPTKLLPFRRST